MSFCVYFVWSLLFGDSLYLSATPPPDFVWEMSLNFGGDAVPGLTTPIQTGRQISL